MFEKTDPGEYEVIRVIAKGRGSVNEIVDYLVKNEKAFIESSKTFDLIGDKHATPLGGFGEENYVEILIVRRAATVGDREVVRKLRELCADADKFEIKLVPGKKKPRWIYKLVDLRDRLFGGNRT